MKIKNFKQKVWTAVAVNLTVAALGAGAMLVYKKLARRELDNG